MQKSTHSPSGHQNGTEANTETFVTRYCYTLVFFLTQKHILNFLVQQKQNLSTAIPVSRGNVRFAPLVESHLCPWAVSVFAPHTGLWARFTVFGFFSFNRVHWYFS